MIRPLRLKLRLANWRTKRLNSHPMRVDLFDFALPEDRIALRPASPRDSARMLVLDGDATHDRLARDLPDCLRAGDILVDIFHEMLLDYDAISPDMEDLSDRLLATADYAPVMQEMFDEAYADHPEKFKLALLDARDILGTYLADTWERLNRQDLNFVDVGDVFLQVDQDHTGGRFASIIRGNFRLRDIGFVEVGPQLAPLDKDSHANSVRTMLPMD